MIIIGGILVNENMSLPTSKVGDMSASVVKVEPKEDYERVIEKVEEELGKGYAVVCKVGRSDKKLIEYLGNESQSVIRSMVVYRILTYKSFIGSEEYKELGYGENGVSGKQLEVFMNCVEKMWCKLRGKEYDESRYIKVKG